MTSDKSQNKLEFRRTQAADPATNTRRCGKSKQMKKGYVIYVTDIGRKCGAEMRGRSPRYRIGADR